MACAWHPHVAIVICWKCSSNVERRRLSRLQTTSDKEADHLKELKPNGGQLFNTHSTDLWNFERRPSVSLYLDKLPIQKCKFRERFNVSIFSLERLPRGVHTTLTNPVWSAHLLRNSLSNYWCGTHRTCNNTLFKPDERNWLTRRESLCEENLSVSLQKFENVLMQLSLPLLTVTSFRLRQQYRKEMKIESTCRF